MTGPTGVPAPPPPTARDGGTAPAVPGTRRDDTVDVLHGVSIPDPYRWLETTGDPDVRAWITAQNEVTAGYLGALPERRAFHDRLAAAWNYPRRSPPRRRGTAWMQLRNDGLQDQDVIFTASADPLATGTPTVPPDPHWSVLLDPNTLSEDGTVSLADAVLSPDGGLLAYALSEAGSDWMTWRIRDVGTGVDLGDEVRWAKFSPAAWLPDGAGFLYGGYAAPPAGAEHLAASRNHEVRLHLLGTDADPVVYARPDEPEWTFEPAVSHDGTWLVLSVWRGTDPANRVHIAEIRGGMEVGPVRPLLDDGDARWTFLGVVDGWMWFHTDEDAPLGRIVAVDPYAPEHRREIVRQGRDRIEQALVVGAHGLGADGWLLVHRLEHATSRLHVHDLAGTHRRAVLARTEAPTAITGLSAGREDDAAFVASETFTAPARIHRLDLRTGQMPLVHAPPDPETVRVATSDGRARTPALAATQVFVEHDGPTIGDRPVRVPVFLVHRDDVRPSGQVPTVLYGYGGFDIPVLPTFKVEWRAWVEAGGLLAVACLRGGGEYGQQWHDDGRLDAKTHTFDDALAVADWLCGSGTSRLAPPPAPDDPPLPTPIERVPTPWTAPAHLGLTGRSNGGLLAGACLTRRPEAFGAVVPEVGVLDLLRYHRFTIGWAWTSDYGNPDDPSDFRALLTYSPLHNVRPGSAYPATLITTADTDDRVVPGHSLKFAAALQAAQGADEPILLRVDTSAGHGVGKPVSKLIDERADVYAFLAHHLRLHVRARQIDPEPSSASTA